MLYIEDNLPLKVPYLIYAAQQIYVISNDYHKVLQNVKKSLMIYYNTMPNIIRKFVKKILPYLYLYLIY